MQTFYGFYRQTVGMQLTLRPQNRVISLIPDRPILEAALAAHMNLPHSCKGGNCGSCRAHLLSGQVSYPRGRTLGLSETEYQAGEVLLCQAVALTDVVVEAREIRRVSDVEIKALPCRVERLERWAPDVMGVYLRLPAIEDFQFQAGQYLDVMLPGHRRRSFSIASPPHDAGLIELHIRQVAGGEFTSAVFDTLTVGDLLRIEGPLGHFVYQPVDEVTAPLVLVAGGTGFSPIKSILRHVLESGVRRPIHVYWGAKRELDLYQSAWLMARVPHFAGLRVVTVLSEGVGEETQRHRAGWLQDAILQDFPDLHDAHVYAAGPPQLIAALKEHLPRQGLPLAQLYFDSFDYAPDEQSRT